MIQKSAGCGGHRRHSTASGEERIGRLGSKGWRGARAFPLALVVLHASLGGMHDGGVRRVQGGSLHRAAPSKGPWVRGGGLVALRAEEEGGREEEGVVGGGSKTPGMPQKRQLIDLSRVFSRSKQAQSEEPPPPPQGEQPIPPPLPVRQDAGRKGGTVSLSRRLGWLAGLRGPRQAIGTPKGAEGILGEVLRNQVEVLAAALSRLGWRSLWMQAALSVLSMGAMTLSSLMYVNAAASSTPSQILWGGVWGGLAAGSASLLLSSLHLAWTLGYVLNSGRVRALAERSGSEGLGPLLGKFVSIRASLNRGTWIGIAGALTAFVSGEQVLGSMVARMVMAKGCSVAFWVTNPPARLQALDIFSVQASVLVLVSHLVGLWHTSALKESVPAHN